jgi:predicted RNA-binding Zn-ribbon protein involved in translation (DUF1610 family)
MNMKRLERITCPHCGFVYRTEIELVIEDGRAIVVRGPNGTSPRPGKEMRIDQMCPNCGKVFEWQVK